MSGAMAPVPSRPILTSVAFNWHLFSGAYAAIDEPLTNAVDAALENLIGVRQSNTKGTADDLHHLDRSADALGADWRAGQWTDSPCGPWRGDRHAAVQYVHLQSVGRHCVFLHTIPDGLGNALNGTIGSGAITGGTQFDDIWNGAWKAGLVVYKNLPEWSMKGAFLALAVIAFWVSAFIAVVWAS